MKKKLIVFSFFVMFIILFSQIVSADGDDDGCSWILIDCIWNYAVEPVVDLVGDIFSDDDCDDEEGDTGSSADGIETCWVGGERYLDFEPGFGQECYPRAKCTLNMYPVYGDFEYYVECRDGDISRQNECANKKFGPFKVSGILPGWNTICSDDDPDAGYLKIKKEGNKLELKANMFRCRDGSESCYTYIENRDTYKSFACAASYIPTALSELEAFYVDYNFLQSSNLSVEPDLNKSLCVLIGGEWLLDETGIWTKEEYEDIGFVNFCCGDDDPYDDGQIALSYDNKDEFLCEDKKWKTAFHAENIFRIAEINKPKIKENAVISYDAVSNHDKWINCESIGPVELEDLNYAHDLARIYCYKEGKRYLFIECCGDQMKTAEGSCFHETTEGESWNEFPKKRHLGSVSTMLLESEAITFNRNDIISKGIIAVDDVNLDVPVKDWSEYIALEFFITLTNITAPINLEIDDSYYRILFDEPIMDYVVNTPAENKPMHVVIPVREWRNVRQLKFYNDPKIFAPDYTATISKIFLRPKQEANLVYCSDETWSPSTPVLSSWTADLDGNEAACDANPAYGWTGTKCCGDDGLNFTEIEISATIYPNNLIAYLRFDEGDGSAVNDSIANKYNGMLIGEPDWRIGKINKALRFDGNDYVNISGGGPLDIQGDYSTSAWIKTEPSQAIWAPVYVKTTSPGNNAYTLQFDDTAERNLIVFHNNPGPSWDTGINLADIKNRWHHIAVVRTGTNMKSYLDGIKIGDSNFNINPSQGSGPMYIGADRVLTYFLNGLVDELIIFNISLTAEEIENIFENKHMQESIVKKIPKKEEYYADAEKGCWNSNAVEDDSTVMDVEYEITKFSEKTISQFYPMQSFKATAATDTRSTEFSATASAKEDPALVEKIGIPPDKDSANYQVSSDNQYVDVFFSDTGASLTSLAPINKEAAIIAKTGYTEAEEAVIGRESVLPIAHVCDSDSCIYPLPEGRPIQIKNLHPGEYNLFIVSQANKTMADPEAETDDPGAYVLAEKIKQSVLFYNGSFYGCKAPDYILNINSSLIDNTSDYCTVKGTHFCSYNNEWSDEAGGAPNSSSRNTAKQVPAGASLVNISEFGCCPSDHCWNGISCVADMSADPNATVEINNTLYSCIKGDWKIAVKKFTWDYAEYGVCPSSTQCLIGLTGNADYNNNISMYFGPNYNQNPICIETGQFIEDHYCHNGNWTSRTKLIATQLLDISGEINSFTLYCDKYNKILPGYGDTYVRDTLIEGKVVEELQGIPFAWSCFNNLNEWNANHNYNKPCANNFCSLTYNTPAGPNIVLAASVNKPLDFSLDVYQPGFGYFFLEEVFGVNKNYCDDLIDAGNDFAKCSGDSKFWYSDRLSSVISSFMALDGIVPLTAWDKIKGFFRGIFEFILGWEPLGSMGAAINASFMEQVSDFNQICIAKAGAKEAYLVMETADPTKVFLTAKYVNLVGTDICSIVDTLDLGNINYNCTQANGGYIVYAEPFKGADQKPTYSGSQDIGALWETLADTCIRLS
jgi:hypothetical protein